MVLTTITFNKTTYTQCKINQIKCLNYFYSYYCQPCKIYLQTAHVIYKHIMLSLVYNQQRNTRIESKKCFKRIIY